MRHALLVLALSVSACHADDATDVGKDTDVTADSDVADDTQVATDTDDTDDVTPVTCDPLGPPGAQGCHVGEKCTWITLDATSGMLGCAPDGTVAVGGLCARGADGETTGYDNCVAGGVCVGSTCKDLCGFDGSLAGACGEREACTRVLGLFEAGGADPVAGACSATCNPLSQTLDAGGTCPVGEGCYTLTDTTTTVAVCATAGTGTHGQALVGAPVANSCAPGFAARRPFPTSTDWECGALCAPADVTSTENTADEGGVSPHTCEAAGAAAPSDPTAGESCRYFWGREPFDTVSPFSNTLGFCFEHAVYEYDTNGDQVPDAPFPRCTDLTRGDVVPPIGNPPGNDALEFWCLARPMALRRLPSTARQPFALPAWMDRVAR